MESSNCNSRRRLRVKVGFPSFLILGLIAFWLQELKIVELPQERTAHADEHVPVDANIFVNLSKKLIPSVVNISSISVSRNPFVQGSPDDVLRKFFGDLFRQYHSGGSAGKGDPDEGGGGYDDDPLPNSRGPSRMPQAMSLGTGFIIDASGLILTNNHVVADADEIKISFTEAADEKPTDAEVVGRDAEIDVALIMVKSKREMSPVSLGDSDALEVGEYVMAVGNPFGQGHSVTHGIISAKGRAAPDFPLANYLQTDAPINPGNSGGPLVNLKGEVIGINNAVDQRAQGIGFAIPINLVKKVLPQLRSKGSVSRGYIGVIVENLTPEIASKTGVSKDINAPIVTHVYPGDPADRAGMKAYDVILQINGIDIHSRSDLMNAVTSSEVNEKIPVKLSRAGKEKIISIVIGQRPGSFKALSKGAPKKKKPKKAPQIETGMTVQDLTSEITRELGISSRIQGVVVSNVAYEGPADKAGLIRGDLILEVDRKPVTSEEDFDRAIRTKKSYLLRVRRTDPQGQEVFQFIMLEL